MSILFRSIAHNAKTYRNEVQISLIISRKLSIVPSLYDGEQDPAPKFFSPNVQILLKRLTRPDVDKIFRKRTNRGLEVLRAPRYKFLTDEELQKELMIVHKKADRLLQMPPVVKVHKPINDILSKDPALTGYTTSKYLFTDISFGVINEHRLIVERNQDGSLCSCDHDTRKRLNQTYFPMIGRKIRDPVMFTDEERLHKLLDTDKYEFVLDRACIQYEPDEPMYQKVTSIAYQHIDATNNYNLLRSTRHFGPLVFYLSWQQTIDRLMLELLQTAAIRDAVCLVALRQVIHGDVTEAKLANDLLSEIYLTSIQLKKPELVTEEDIKLDTKCVECVEKYVNNNSSMKNQHELALQGYREMYQQLIELSRGLRKAHGAA